MTPTPIGQAPATLALVRLHLDKARACSREGSALFDRAASLVDQAFDLIPLGARLRWDGNLIDLVVEKRTDGWWGVAGGFSGQAEDDWVRENWGRSNWALTDEAGPR